MIGSRLSLFLCLIVLPSCSHETVLVESDIAPKANTLVSEGDFDTVFRYVQSRTSSNGSEPMQFNGFELRLRGTTEIRFGTRGHSTALLRRGDGIVSLVKSRDGNMKARNAAYAAFQELLQTARRAELDGTVK